MLQFISCIGDIETGVFCPLFCDLSFICRNKDNAPSNRAYAGDSPVLHQCNEGAVAGCPKTKLW